MNHSTSTPNRIAISCGELSGDEHAAKLVLSIKKLIPNAEIKGMGGRNLRAAGVETIVDSERSAAVMGFTELLGSAGRIFSSFSAMKTLLKTWKPQLLILVDYPDFNMRLAKIAKSEGIKVLYYIAPKVWAWRKGRIKAFSKYIDQIAAIFPFEEKFLKEHGYSQATFVGHPFIDYLKDLPDKPASDIRKELGLDENAPVLAVFPGSRKSEIKRLFGVMLSGLELFLKEHPEVQAIVNVAPSLDLQKIQDQVPSHLPIKIVKYDSIRILQMANAGLLKSGTTNLQAALCGLPFTMFYMSSALSAFIARRLLKIKEFSIVNILRPGTVREILQEFATPQAICQDLNNLMYDKNYQLNLKQQFQEIFNSLAFTQESKNFEGCVRASERVAQMVRLLLTH